MALPAAPGNTTLSSNSGTGIKVVNVVAGAGQATTDSIIFRADGGIWDDTAQNWLLPENTNVKTIF